MQNDEASTNCGYPEPVCFKEFAMRRFVFPLFALLGASMPATAAHAAAYICDAKDIRQIGNDGVPVAPVAGEPQPFQRFSFDDRTGRVDGDNETRVLSLLQKAVGPNALLAVGIQKGLGNTALQVLKIDTAVAGKMPFVWISDDTVSTGVCTED